VVAVTTAQTVLVSVGASALVTLVLIGLAMWIRRPAKEEAVPDQAIDRVVDELTARMDAMGRELTEALAKTQEESRRNRVLGELAGTIDLDEVLNRTLDAAGALPGVDAALINVLGPDDEPVTTAVGITPEEAEEYSVGNVPAGRRIRSLILDFAATPPCRGTRRSRRSSPAWRCRSAASSRRSAC
jgi:hypothetical protein